MRRRSRCLTLVIAVFTAASPAIMPAYTAEEEHEAKPAADTAYTTPAIKYTYTNAMLTPPMVRPSAVPSEKPEGEKAADAQDATANREDYVEAAAVPDGTRTSLGVFDVTAYCGCPVCCGKWSGMEMSITTQAGHRYPVEGYTISVDPKVIPLRSVVELEGCGLRYAHDTGGMIKGKRIDLYFSDHDDALAFGRRSLEVWIWE